MQGVQQGRGFEPQTVVMQGLGHTNTAQGRRLLYRYYIRGNLQLVVYKFFDLLYVVKKSPIYQLWFKKSCKLPHFHLI